MFIYTFPDPTGPIIATKRPGLTVKFMLFKEFSDWSFTHFAVALETTMPRLFVFSSKLFISVNFTSLVSALSGLGKIDSLLSFSSYKRKFCKILSVIFNFV